MIKMQAKGSRLKAFNFILRNNPLAFILLVACATTRPTPIVIIQPVAPSPIPLPTLTLAPPPIPGGLWVDPAQDLGPISPLIYGSNYGPWLFVPLEVRPQAIAAKISILRFPGGNWGDLNDIEDWQLDQYFALCRELGAEPSISVRLKGGAAAQASALVKLLNVTKQYSVRYWSIGNEPNLYGQGYTVEQFNTDWRAWATAMRAVDPTIKLLGPETSQFFAQPTGAYQQAVNNWLAEFLKANGDLVDVVTIHRYPYPQGNNGPPPTIAELRANSREWDELIPALRALIRETTGRDLPVGVTEVNSSWANFTGGEATPDSYYNAIWWGDSLGRMMRQGVDIVTQFAIVGELGLMDKHAVHPTYYVYLMYQKFGNERLYASSPDPNLSLFAAQRPDGTLTLMLINLASESITQPLTLVNTHATAAETWLFDKTHNAVQVDATSLTAPLTFPPESMTLLLIP